MTSIRKLLSALFLALCFSAYSNAQVSTSGELINNGSWSGATYGADPGGCCASISGSGALYDTTTDTIMFSYGQSILSQTIGLNQALGGTGIQVHGFNYSWDFRVISNNGNMGNEILKFYVDLRDAAGNVVENYEYNRSWGAGYGLSANTWFTDSGTETFANSYTDPQSITLRILGRDGGFWAGYYGPEVRNVSLSVNYSFDPCASDPLYSSACPGYLEAYMANLFAMLGWSSTPEPVAEVASIDYSLPAAVSISAMPEESTTGEVKVDAGGIEVSTTGELSVPDGIPEEVKEKKPVDMNLIMSIVREATDDSKALDVVNQSIQDSLSEDSNPNFTGVSSSGDLLENEIISSLNLRGTSSSSSSQDQTGMSTDEEVTTKEQTTEVQASSQQQMVTDQTQEQQEEVTVKQNVEPNEAASGVDIASIAVSPTGFNDYLTKSLNDARFYEEKEIYTGQAVVDNRRAQRLLNGASDRLHREMVDQQYRQ